jgi:hypothetical protein
MHAIKTYRVVAATYDHRGDPEEFRIQELTVRARNAHLARRVALTRLLARREFSLQLEIGDD